MASVVKTCQIDGVLAGGQSAQAKDVACRAKWSLGELVFATTVATTQYYNTELSGLAREQISNLIKQLQPY